MEGFAFPIASTTLCQRIVPTAADELAENTALTSRNLNSRM